MLVSATLEHLLEELELSLCTKREEECAERNVYSRPHLVKWTPARYGVVVDKVRGLNDLEVSSEL